MGKKIDRVGQRFGRLTVVEESEVKTNNKIHWVCECDCGNRITIPSGAFVTGNTKSCGCYKKDKFKEVITKHGLRNHPMYRSWANMKQRCNNKKCEFYRHYGGRGIVYDPRWEEFINFYEDMVEGYEENLELDRINVNGNYNKRNCRWTTRSVNCNNQRVTGKTSKYKGVNKSKSKTKFAAAISVNNIRIYLGNFTIEEDAARAYDKFIEDNNLEYTTNKDMGLL